MKNAEKEYYLGLDIGTDSVGYAVTDKEYNLLKFKGEPAWGVHTFEAANLQDERRSHRTARRRLDRRQQRVDLLSEMFAGEICKIDENFFVRRKESALFSEDAQYGVNIFNGGSLTDKEYHSKYPTIHHLILDLMNNGEAHDVRLVYLACAWLVANRGHFLYDIASDDIERLSDFEVSYADFINYLSDSEYAVPWDEAITAQNILGIMRMKTGISKKKDAFYAEIFGGKKQATEKKEGFPFNRTAIAALLCGAKLKPSEIFNNDEYAEIDSVSLSMDDENFARIVSEIGDDGEILVKLRAMYDCTLLIETLNGEKSISAAKVAVYDRHKEDLEWLKYFVRKYKKEKYNEIFRADGKENYVAYSYNVKSCKNPDNVKKVKKDVFCDYLKKTLKDIKVAKKDEAKYEDMLSRLELRTFLPKQKDSDNRVIPQQLYRYELNRILENASGYLPFLNEKDSDGLSVKNKALAIFDFKIPYFVGPLNAKSSYSWIGGNRKPGRIYPWNFEDMVDFDKCEEAFIRRMTNKCTYLPGEDVLPAASLLYSKYNVLNEINNLKINGEKLPVSVKQDIYNELFLKKARVTPKNIADYLKARAIMTNGDELSGVDVTIKSSLKTYHEFERLLGSGTLSEQDVEAIVNHAAYSEDKSRMSRWLEKEYPALSESDRKYILRLNLKGFGRLSAEFLNGIIGADIKTGEAFTIIEALWNTNDNLMQLLSGRYTFTQVCSDLTKEYYANSSFKLSDRLSEMYISNAVKRPILRTLDITGDVVKAFGCAPKKIFVEMARGGTPDQQGKRTKSRKDRLLELYKEVKTEDARLLAKELEEMPNADNRLQSDKLFLYYLQLGKCVYSGQAIDLNHLSDDTYNIDHIYPQSIVKDDSIDNRVLVLSTVNGEKSDVYPLPEEIRNKMRSYWEYLVSIGLMSKEKLHRLTRMKGFTEEEKAGFINRQLVETRQSTKAVAQILGEKYPDAEIVYVKAGTVSEFRQEFDLVKCREVNNLHHAKDAYLNIVVGNVYNERFSKKWFNLNEKYNIQVKKVFAETRKNGNETYWQGGSGIAKVKKTMQKNCIHQTRYAFCRKGGYFDQMPVKAKEGLVPLKEGLNTTKYGGYNKPTASFFALAKCTFKGKAELMILPIDLMNAALFDEGEAGAIKCVTDSAETVTGKRPEKVELPLGTRKIKVNTVFSFDGMEFTLSGKTGGGKQIGISPLTALYLGYEWDKYIKKLSSFADKYKRNPNIQLDEKYDGITIDKNIELYDMLANKLSVWPFSNMPNNQKNVLLLGRELFLKNTIYDQISLLLNVLLLINSGKPVNLTPVDGPKLAGVAVISSNLTNWKKTYNNVCIIDYSASGLFSAVSENLLDMI